MTSPRLNDPLDYGNLPGDGPLRVDGVSVPAIPLTDDNLPSTPSKAVKAQQASLKIVRDCFGGPLVVRDCGQTYLPRDLGEDGKSYADRLSRSVLFNVFGETIIALTGFVFAKDPVLSDDVPPDLQAQWENIDNAGTHGDVFAREQFQDALTAGHCGILVDFPQTDGTQTKADEMGKDAPIRPYWVPICKDNIVSWRTSKVNGKLVLTQIVFKETTMVPAGDFGEREQVRYRVLFRDDAGAIRGRLLEVNSDQKTVTEVASWNYPTQDEIPFVEVSTSGKTGLLESKPPLLDLAFLNIAHYQQWSDRAVSVHKTCVPIWVETGIDPASADIGPGVPLPPIVLGPNSSRRFANEHANARYESHSGQALAEVTKVIDELKTDMATLGISMLAPQVRSRETATGKRIDKGATDSKLSVAARALQDALERALYFHARYLKLDSGGSVKVNREFESTQMAPDLLLAYVSAVSNAGIPVRLLLEAMQDGGLLEPDEDITALEAEVEANKAAAEQQKQLEAANRLAAAAGMTDNSSNNSPAAKAA